MGVDITKPDFNDSFKYFRINETFVGGATTWGDGELGKHRWRVRGTNVAAASQVSAAAGLHGPVNINTSAADDDFSEWYLPEVLASIPTGTRFEWRLKGGATNVAMWAGIGTGAVVPVVGGAVDLMGVRYDLDEGSGNVLGVVKSGAATEATQVIDTWAGVQASPTTLGFLVMASGVQFYTDRTPVGAPVSLTTQPDGGPWDLIFGIQKLDAPAVARTFIADTFDIIVPTGN